MVRCDRATLLVVTRAASNPQAKEKALDLMTDNPRASDVDQPPAVNVDRLPCAAADDDEPMGGDPPCWAHLFEDEPPSMDQQSSRMDGRGAAANP